VSWRSICPSFAPCYANSFRGLLVPSVFLATSSLEIDCDTFARYLLQVRRGCTACSIITQIMAAIYERNGYGQGFGDTVNLPDRPNGRFARNVQARGSPWHPRNWALRTKLCAGFGAVVLLIIIVVPAVVVTRNNRYPAYSKLNYTLKDTCKLKQLDLEADANGA
jgi:hypothetical protein